MCVRRIVLAFCEYPRSAELDIRRWHYSFSRLPERHKQMLTGQLAKFSAGELCTASIPASVFEDVHVVRTSVHSYAALRI